MCSVVEDHLPATLGPETASIQALEREICELAAHIAAATCQWLELVAEFDQRGGWAEWGVKSCAHWLSWRCSIGLVAARQHVRVAHRLRELPMVRGYAGALSASLGTAQRVHDQRHVRWSWNEDGSLRLEARLPAEDGALVVKALDAFAASPGEGEDYAESPAGACRADALAAMAQAALTAAPAEGGGGQPCELVVHVDARTLAADEVVERCHVTDGPALAPETARRLGCDGAVVRIVERDGRPISVGRRTRSIPPALRRALRSRDGGCRFPGCTHERFLHAHHIRHWARGGPTTLENLVQLCSYHHRLVHEGGFRVEAAGRGAVAFRRPDGRVVAQAPGCGPARGPGLAQRQRARGLVVDQNTCRPLSAGDRLDYDLAVDVLMARALAAG